MDPRIPDPTREKRTVSRENPENDKTPTRSSTTHIENQAPPINPELNQTQNSGTPSLNGSINSGHNAEKTLNQESAENDKASDSSIEQVDNNAPPVHPELNQPLPEKIPALEQQQQSAADTGGDALPLPYVNKPTSRVSLDLESYAATVGGTIPREALEVDGIPAPYEGQQVYRIWGQNQDSAGHMMFSGARPNGRSWTPINPANSSNFRVDAGLPRENPARFISEGTLRCPGNVVEMRCALPLDGNSGGWPEYLIEDSDHAVELSRVAGVNESWTIPPGGWTSTERSQRK